MPHPFQIFSQSGYLIQVVDINSHTDFANSADPDQLASEKPTDLDLHCLQKQCISGFSRTRVKIKRQAKTVFPSDVKRTVVFLFGP